MDASVVLMKLWPADRYGKISDEGTRGSIFKQRNPGGDQAADQLPVRGVKTPLFTKNAMELIHRASGGILRTIGAFANVQHIAGICSTRYGQLARPYPEYLTILKLRTILCTYLIMYITEVK